MVLVVIKNRELSAPANARNPQIVSFSTVPPGQLCRCQSTDSPAIPPVFCWEVGTVSGSQGTCVWVNGSVRQPASVCAPTEHLESMRALNVPCPSGFRSKVDSRGECVTTLRSRCYFLRSFFHLNFHNDIVIITKWQEIDVASLKFYPPKCHKNGRDL